MIFKTETNILSHKQVNCYFQLCLIVETLLDENIKVGVYKLYYKKGKTEHFRRRCVYCYKHGHEASIEKT